jgi:glycosyltransferase involved in cell wall biosynthesis
VSKTTDRKIIIYAQYANAEAYPPLEQSSRIFADKGWDVFFFSLRLDEKPSGNLLFENHPNIYMRYLPWQSPGIRQKFHFIRYNLWVLGCTIVLRPKILYLSQPESSIIGLLASYITRVRIIYHEHDAPSSDSLSAFMRFLLYVRRQIARRANLCIIPNEKRVESFRQETRTIRPLRVVWNCPRIAEVVPPRSDDEKGSFVIWYHGSIVPFRLPLTIINALARLPAHVELRIAGYVTSGYKEYLNDLLALCRELGVEDRVIYLGTLPTRKVLFNECKKADLGLAFANPEEDINTSADSLIGASNKPFDYLACGVGLLTSPQNSYQSLFVEPGYGIACDPTNVDSLVSTLNWAIKHPNEILKMGEAGRQRILSDWNYEAQFDPILDYLI